MKAITVYPGKPHSMLRHLTEDKEAIKVYIEVAQDLSKRRIIHNREAVVMVKPTTMMAM